PLPPAEGKQRLALCVALRGLARTAPPLPLHALLAVAGLPQHAALQALLVDAQRQGVQPRVFGSFAWQALTGLAYVHAASDLDLLWTVTTPAQADTVVALLQRWERRYRLRADGELLLDVGAVNWREYAGQASQLLLKSDHGCRLLPRAALFPVWSAA
ncbi:malonate decarboxylase holo-[acyl-carrier-protein] synthase, partial [Xanthomonas maliensis]